MAEQIHIKTNPDVLKWARESIAMSGNEAVKRSKISISRLNQLENGIKHPSMEELLQLGKTYKRTIATLLLKEPPKEKPLPKDRRTVDSRQLNHFNEKTIVAVRKARALTRSLIELKQEAGIPIKKFDLTAGLHDSPAEIALRLHDLWNISELRQIGNSNEVLEAYIDLVESLGIAVFQISLTKDYLRGFSLVDEQLPVIVLKRGGESATAKIFTLFHELAHLILHEEGVCDISFNPEAQKIEKWCNAFAGEILVPSTQLFSMDIVQQYAGLNKKRWARKDVFELVNYFHVGPLAILRRLLDKGLITNGFYREKHDKWNKPSFGRSKHPEGRNIPKEALKERGRTFVRLAFSVYDQNKINLKDLSDFLGVKLDNIPKTRLLLNS
ncbi:MAG: ImmA/IrrE family metallo-endopeptidase [Bacteroidales bacterium]|nr:ImmA/IrrE family metallo-endopeptidase [Bacteroidales bacterium]MCF8350553.1 ImmA/IrrE family metallo-endopeptidase [Bacteroidales bacterium]MCF8376600.1 ImmA/IrrE family metallo-endopeptidase [Bacteroidales bacterium]MCF8401185.1 ImmA/IrrE family metallo-endopeptidase [Bacteroidales bacterium]